MTIDQTEQILLFIARYGFEALIAGCVVFLLIKYFLPGYLSEKGKNLATKDDISEITDKIESVKAEYSKEIETFLHHNRLKLAAFDRRLETYQQAYTLWLKLRRSVHNKEKSFEMVIECQKWWENNCIYLDSNSRNDFIDSIHAVALHPDLTGGKATKDEVKENWEYINKCGESLLKGAGLPSIGENELKEIDEIDHISANNANAADR